MKLLTFSSIHQAKNLQESCDRALPSEVENIISILEIELNKINKTNQSGIGLAAPQIGIKKQVAIIRCAEICLNLVNPVLIQGFEKFIFLEEGCLSFPGTQLRTARYRQSVWNNDVFPFKFIATNLISVACQHEADHLQGITIFDRQV